MISQDPYNSTRRHFLGRGTGIALGAIALNALNAEADSSTASGSLTGTDFPAKAKRVIYLTQSGGPSQIELFDYKPNLAKLEGTMLPDSIRQGQRLTTMTANQKQIVMGPRARFRQYGESGATVGEWLPHIGSVADDLCFVKSMYTEYINHAPAMTFMLTGHQIPGRPSVGAWASYGLGSENRNLPDYIVLVSKMQRPSDQPLYEYYWGSGFLPSRYQGVKFRSGSEPVLYLNDPHGVSRKTRRTMLDSLGALNRLRQKQTADPEIDTRIRQYEMSYRMQNSVPELMNLSDETEATFKLYGPESRRPGSYAANCILARRLAERGVRFVQLFHPDWDHHKKMTAWCPDRCRDTDQPTAALIHDLKQRGLLEDTLVVWCTEFGRMPMFQKGAKGRDHNPQVFTAWHGGAGIKPGASNGQTDELGFKAVEDVSSIHDLNATILHLLGLEHTQLTYRHNGIDRRLTDVHGHVLRPLLAGHSAP